MMGGSSGCLSLPEEDGEGAAGVSLCEAVWPQGSPTSGERLRLQPGQGLPQDGVQSPGFTLPGTECLILGGHMGN